MTLDNTTATPAAGASVQISSDMGRYPNLRTHREQRGLSQMKLAALAGVGKDLIASAERGNPHRRIKLLNVIHALNEHERTKSYGVIAAETELINE